MTILESVRQSIETGHPPMPVSSLIGFRVTAIEPGRTWVEMQTQAHHDNPMGIVHGGVIAAIADTALGLACGSTLGEGEGFATIELKINFLRSVQPTSLVAEGVVVHRGRQIGMTECAVTDQEGRLVAKASSTCMAIRPRGPGREPTDAPQV